MLCFCFLRIRLIYFLKIMPLSVRLTAAHPKTNRRNRSNQVSVDRKSLRAKTMRVARKLEGTLGTPRQASELPNPLEMLIATVLSQNTNDKNSHRAYSQLRQRFSSWDKVAHAPLRSLKSAIRVGGMANQKAVRIKEILKAVKSRYGKYDISALKTKSDADVVEELTELNGVGVKTASCVLLFSMGRDVFPVDTHIHRICSRLGLVNGKTAEKTFELMRSLIPKGRAYSLHTNLIRFGRKICRSNKPACEICPIYNDCVYEGKKTKWTARQATSTADHDFMLLDNVQTLS